MIEMLSFYQNLYFTAILSEYISHDTLKNENNYKMNEVRTIFLFSPFQRRRFSTITSALKSITLTMTASLKNHIHKNIWI